MATIGLGLPSGTTWAVAGFSAFSTLLFIIFTTVPVEAAQSLGTGSILLLAGAAWISVGSLLVHVSRRFAIPIFRIIAALVVLFSLTNDNHAIRQITNAPIPKRLPAPEEHFAGWEKNVARFSSKERRRPIFIVATEGGGIRAAYWTATVLGELQQSSPHFASHLFAISGVSGGSLGGTVFTALLAQNRTNNIKRDAQAILSHDFLAPTVAYMLYPDLAQRFLPGKINAFDRARALEYAWEKAWMAEVGNNFFAQPFQSLWTNGAPAPALFLNGTCVESGNRIITSNLYVSDFAHAENSYDRLNSDIPISTAVHMSARFTYVSPAGLFGDGAHVVDGGYFENSGAATAEEIKYSLEAGPDSKTDIYYILINSEGELPRHGKLLNEVVIPIRALLNTRTARASYSTALVIDDSIEFTLDLRGNSIPLGWQLSRVAMNEIERQLRSPQNAAALGKVRSILRTD